MIAAPFRTAPAIAELSELDQWVISKPVCRRGKLDKPPFSPLIDDNHKKPWMCSHSNPADWSSYDDACAALTSYSFQWLGFVFYNADPYSGIDLDGCRDPQTGAIELWAQHIIDQAHSYTEISPSGTGVKIFVRGKLPEAIKYSMGVHKGIEVYSRQRYFTVTGQHLLGTPLDIRDAQSLLDQLQREYNSPKFEPKPAQPTQAIRPAQPRAGRLSARDTIDQANHNNDLGAYLESKGATLVRIAGDVRYYSSIAGEQHEHAVTYIVSPAKDCIGQIGYSYSPNGKLNNVDFRRGFRFFDTYTALDQAGDLVAALKALCPTPSPRQRREEPPPPEPEQRRAQTPEQAADAARKRAANARVKTDLHERIRQTIDCDKHARPSERAVIHAMVDWMAEHNAEACTLGRASIARRAGYSFGAVKTAIGRLEARGYFVSDGAGGRPIDTARRNFSRGSLFAAQSIAASEHDPRIVLESLDLVNLEACEAAPEAPAREPEAWELWEASDPECTGYDLALERDDAQPVEPEALPQVEPADQAPEPVQVVSVGRPDARGMCLVRWSDGSATWEPASAQEEASGTSDDVVTGPAGAIAVVGGAAYVPADAEAWYQAMQQAQIARRASEPGAQVARLPEVEPEPAPKPADMFSPPRVAPSDTPTKLDRYRADVALMSERRLNGEVKRLQNIEKKHSSAFWYAKSDYPKQLAIVQAEIAQRAGGLDQRRSERAGADPGAAHKLKPPEAQQAHLIPGGSAEWTGQQTMLVRAHQSAHSSSFGTPSTVSVLGAVSAPP